MTKNEVNIKEVIKEEYITPVSPYDGKYTKTTQFMLPSVGINVKNKLIYKYFINSYLDDKQHRHEYVRPIFVLFGIVDFNERDWGRVYSALVKSANYIGDYDCGMQEDKNLVMVVFRVPDEFENDYYHFKRGRYSKFSSAYKEKFPRYLDDDGSTSRESIIWQAIHKSPDLIKQLEEIFDTPEGHWNDAAEIWDKPRKNREYYRYEEIILGRQPEST